MKFFVNTEVVNRLVEDAGRLPVFYENALQWHVCPNCLWLSLAYVPPSSAFGPGKGNLPYCPRDRTELPMEVAARVFGNPKKCQNSLWVCELAPKIDAALHSALRVGGTNAVIEIMDALMPIELGIDDLAIGVQDPRGLAELRPDSVRKKR